MVQVGQERTLAAEVGVGLVHHHYAVKLSEDLFHSLPFECSSCGIVGRAEPDDLGIGICGLQEPFGLQGVILSQEYRSVFHVVDVGTHLIHPISGTDGHHVVLSRPAEDTIYEVYGLIASVAHEYLLRSHALHIGQHLPQVLMNGSRVSVKRSIIGTLVCIQIDVCLTSFEFVSGTAVWFQCQYIGSDEFCQFLHFTSFSLSVIAFL